MLYTNDKPFLMPYETLEEARMRLEGSIIKLHGMPVYVSEVGAVRGKKGKFKLYLRSQEQALPNNEHLFEREYGAEDAGFDLSPLPPMYTDFGKNNYQAYYIFRKAVRQYKQGANSNNTVYTLAGTSRQYALAPMNILNAYLKPPVSRTFAEAAAEVKRGTLALVLSKDLAVFKIDDGSVPEGTWGVEYRGQHVGNLVGDTMQPNNESLTLNPWCMAKIGEAGIKIGR